MPTKKSPRKRNRPRRLSTGAGIWPVSLPERMTSCFDAASKAMSEPEWLAPTTSTGPVLELRQVPVVVRVELRDARVELAREVGDVRPLEDARRDDDVVRLEAPVARARDVAAVLPRESVDARLRCAPAARTAPRRPRGSRPSRPRSGTRSRRAGKRIPGRPSRLAGEYSFRESHRARQLSPMRSLRSRITNDRPCRLRW